MARKLKGSAHQMCLTADVQDDVIATGYEKGLVNFWDLRCKIESPTLSGHCGTTDSKDGSLGDVSSIVYANQRKQDVYISAGTCIYQLDMRKLDRRAWEVPLFNCSHDDINQITISEDDEMLAVADDNNIITVFNLRQSRLLASLEKHENMVYTVKFRQGKARELISGGYDCLLIHWDVLKKRPMGSYNLSNFSDVNWDLPKSFNPSYVLSCDFGSLYLPHKKPNIVLAGTDNGNLHCFFCQKHLQHYQTFKAHNLGVTKVHLTSSSRSGDASRYAYSGSNDGTIKMWDVHQLFTEFGMADAPKALHVIDHGSKINYMCSIKNTSLVICDTSCDVTVLPLEFK